MDQNETENVPDTNGEAIPEQQPPEERPESYGEMPTPAAEQTSNDQATLSSTSDAKSGEDAGYFGPRRKRIVAVALILMWVCIFVFPRWAQPGITDQDLEDAYKLHLAGAILIFSGLLVVFVAMALEGRYSFLENRIMKFVFAGAFLLGGFLYWVGGIQLAKTINDSASGASKDDRYHISGLAGTVFIEATFIALIVIALDVDIIFNYLSKSERVRTYYVFNTILAFVSLVAFFSYAAWRAAGTGLNASTAGCVAAGWFFVLISTIYWYVIEFIDICCKCAPAVQASVKLKKNSIQLAGVVILLFGAFLVMVGMWSIATVSNKRWNAYYAGYGFFVFFYCFFLALDIYLGRIIDERRKK